MKPQSQFVKNQDRIHLVGLLYGSTRYDVSDENSLTPRFGVWVEFADQTSLFIQAEVNGMWDAEFLEKLKADPYGSRLPIDDVAPTAFRTFLELLNHLEQLVPETKRRYR